MVDGPSLADDRLVDTLRAFREFGNERHCGGLRSAMQGKIEAPAKQSGGGDARDHAHHDATFCAE